MSWQVHVWNWQTGSELGSCDWSGRAVPQRKHSTAAPALGMAFNDHGGKGGSKVKVWAVERQPESCAQSPSLTVDQRTSVPGIQSRPRASCRR